MGIGSLLPVGWEVPQEFRFRLGAKVGRQRVMSADGHLLLALHAPPKPDDPERGGRLFWRTPEGDWTSSQLGKGQGALGRHVDEYADIISRLDEQAEKAATAEAIFALLEELTPIHRAARNLHQVLQEARKLVPQDRDLINLRDRAYELERTAELLFNGLRHALDYAVARRAEEQAYSSNQMALASHRLNVLAAFFFPIATLSALFGTNLKHGLEEMNAPYLFLGLILVGVALGAILLVAVSGRRGQRPGPGSNGT